MSAAPIYGPPPPGYPYTLSTAPIDTPASPAFEANCCTSCYREEPQVMTYVGPGGAYIAETSYRFVGESTGQFEVQAQAATRWTRMSCVASLIGSLILSAIATGLFMYFNLGGTSTTTEFEENNPGAGSCYIWGVTHVQSFDGDFPNFNQQGDLWIIKGHDGLLNVQGRYLATPFTNGLAALHAMVIGGKVMDGHELSLAPMGNGDITCDGKAILYATPSIAKCGPAQLVYNNQADLDIVDFGDGPKEHIVHIRFDNIPIIIETTRWANHLNVRIDRPSTGYPEDICGACGNFNGDDGDDDLMADENKGCAHIPFSELLLRNPQRAGPMLYKTISDCDSNTRNHAFQLCKQEDIAVSGKLLDDCVFDVCFGGDQYAGQDSYVSSAVEVADEVTSVV
mmetsp:Transcript_6136/g.14247  ORF Transcript_6136/g.14247 Transcript_6136/m.14247 type:complete len:396 (-) Transcript_6136:233-1420(-)|eukprot:CAMPEP_0206466380 /NCGR_PEP_ID=MMETSP0324_2-20121206/28420_1 /ASSEMBLY_ACC=CAM_ASM_000836 /TAXON_ID=2866 /ORGANISM="Crypthecodinium cohnii, Strain Seligo" /LENGTH=395 /DNA_ID=CAMNT_0053939477 /DNA_START=197 /DNA_END=1384 /DNA_ORIENTATION=+